MLNEGLSDFFSCKILMFLAIKIQLKICCQYQMPFDLKLNFLYILDNKIDEKVQRKYQQP